MIFWSILLLISCILDLQLSGSPVSIYFVILFSLSNIIMFSYTVPCDMYYLFEETIFFNLSLLRPILCACYTISIIHIGGNYAARGRGKSNTITPGTCGGYNAIFKLLLQHFEYLDENMSSSIGYFSNVIRRTFLCNLQLKETLHIDAIWNSPLIKRARCTT